MNNKATALMLALVVSGACNAEQSDDNVSLRDMLRYLYVTPYDFNNDYMNKMIYFKHPSISDTCALTKKGKYLFADVEGGKINHFPIPFPSPGESFEMPNNEYKEAVDTALSAIRKDYCLDVNLAPVIDFSMADRSYYDSKKEEFHWDQFNTFVQANTDNDIRVTYKHYPPSYHNDPKDHNQERIDAAKTKWAKPSNELSTGYSEVWREQYINDDWNDIRVISNDVLNGISNKASMYDMIMLDNSLFVESGYEPYVSSSLPQHDKFLLSFKGIVITDDLYQLNLNTINVKNLFLNADLFLVSSLPDLRTLDKRLTEVIASDRAMVKLLVEKYNKVKAAYPLR